MGIMATYQHCHYITDNTYAKNTLMDTKAPREGSHCLGHTDLDIGNNPTFTVSSQRRACQRIKVHLVGDKIANIRSCMTIDHPTHKSPFHLGNCLCPFFQEEQVLHHFLLSKLLTLYMATVPASNTISFPLL